MEKVTITFTKPSGDIFIPIVVIKFKYEDKPITLFTNLIQNFFFMDDSLVVPKEIASKPNRGFFYKGRKLIEFDDLIYSLKYEMNNGKSFPEHLLVMCRIEEALFKLKRLETRFEIAKLLKEDGNEDI